jgi:hypothetical protein
MQSPSRITASSAKAELTMLSDLLGSSLYVYWTGLCVLRSTFRQDYETLFNIVILSEHHHHHSLLLACSVISVPFTIFMLTLLLMPLAGLHFCVGLDFVTPSLQFFLSKHHHHHSLCIFLIHVKKSLQY